MHLKRGDRVIVIAGNDKGKTGEVQAVLRGADRLVVDGVNLRWKHRKPSQQNPQGERFQVEQPIHASNVMLLDTATGKGTRKRATQE